MSDEAPEAPKKTGPLRYLRRRDVAFIVTALVLSIAGFAVFPIYRANQKAWLVNGLDMAVDVEIDGKKTHVAAGQRESVRVGDGTHALRALGPGGQTIEEIPFDVPGGSDAVVYNVLGAAPVYSVVITYGSSTTQTDPSEIQFHGGLRTFERSSADFVFTEPPKSIQVKSGESRVRSVVSVAPGGWLSTVSYFEEHQRMALAAELARNVSTAQGDTRSFAYARHYTERAEGSESAIAFLRRALARSPEDVDAHLAYVGAMRRAGRTDEARAEYVERRKAGPGVPLTDAILARIEPQEATATLVRDLLATSPGDLLVQEDAALLALATGDYAASAEHFQKMSGSPRYRYYADEHARALLALGRSKEALAVLAPIADDDANSDLNMALLYAQIMTIAEPTSASGARHKYLDHLTLKAKDPGYRVWAFSLLGNPIVDTDLGAIASTDMRETIRIHVAARRDPKEAWEKCQTASAIAMDRLQPTIALLLAAEFARAGDRATADRLIGWRLDYNTPPAELLAYAVSGEEPQDLWRLDPEWRAALELARARSLEAADEPAEAAFARVEKLDILRSTVTSARKNWPSLRKSAARATRDEKKGALAKRTGGLAIGGVAIGGVVGGVVGGTVGGAPSYARPEVVLRKQP